MSHAATRSLILFAFCFAFSRFAILFRAGGHVVAMGRGAGTWVSFPGCQVGMVKGPRFVLRNYSRRSLKSAKTLRFVRGE